MDHPYRRRAAATGYPRMDYLSTFLEGELEEVKSLEPPPGYVAGLSRADVAA